jgi:prophage regulatory protein
MQPQLLSFNDLKLNGISFSRQHIDRLVKAGVFPRPVKLGLNRNAWIKEEVEAYIASKINERNKAVAKAA